MFVDNDWEQIHLLTKQLENVDGVFVTIRKGGESALEWLKENGNDADAIVIDLAMPLMNGMELTRQIRIKQFKEKILPPFEIIWATAYPIDIHDEHHPIAQDYWAYNVRKMYTKPYDAAEIVEHVMKILNEK
jgi:CheY-like chemotaxis protein